MANLRKGYRATLILAVLLVNQTAYSQSGSVNCPPASCLSVSTKNLITSPSNGMIPLPAPRFMPESGRLPYSTDIGLIVDKTTAVRVVEYSTDNGQNWISGTSFPLLKQGVMLARTREGNRTSAISSTTFDIYYRRMFVLGNSIMVNSPVPGLGWYNNNGMAASSLQNDFVHILQRNMLALNPQFDMKLIAGGGFERTFWT
ncbi:MAG: hypothetical protein LH609_05085, partial [Rudanella sp.]|nr:hypothetical protein [Rudanella sp.]